MESKRQLKFSRLIQKDLAEIFQRDAKGLFGSALITVTRVSMSPDFSLAKIHLSILTTEDRQVVLQKLKENTKAIRNMLAQRISKQVRIIPALVMYLDESVDYAIKMSGIIEDLEIPKETKIDEADYDDLDI
jgi:ribosome-binding factor A